ncbi:hypothetical protein ACWCYZ_12510 [Streptomyces virginiae]
MGGRTSMGMWLASSHPSPEQPWHEWAKRGVAVIPTGAAFDAVRIPEGIVHAAVESTDADTVGVALAERLDGPVIHDARGRNYYVLIRPGVCLDLGLASPGVELLPARTHLGVPATELCEHSPETPIYWAVPGIRPGHCDANAAGLLVRYGARRLAEASL